MRLFLEGGKKLRAVLIREGISVNGNKWTRPVLEMIKNISEGVPFNFYDLSKRGDKTLLHHWEALRMKLPPAIQQFLPERLPEAQIGVVRNPVIESDDQGRAQIVADIELKDDSRGWFTSLVYRLESIGKKLGVSIHVPERGIDYQDLGRGVREPTKVSEVVGFDAVSIASAGGQFLPALEALGQLQEVDPMRKFRNLIRRLRSLVPGDKRGGLDKLGTPDAGIDTVSALLEANEQWVTAVFEGLGFEVTGEARVTFLEGMVSTTPEEEPKKGDPDPAPTKKAVDPATRLEADAVTRKEFEQLSGQMKKIVQLNSRSMLEGVLKEAGLPTELTTFVREEQGAIIESQGFVDEDALRNHITKLKKAIGKSNKNGGALEGGDNPNIAYSHYDSADEFFAAYGAMIMGDSHGTVGEGDNARKVPAIESIRRAYGIFTGDVYCDGREFHLRNRRRPQGLAAIVDEEKMASVLEGDFKAFIEAPSAPTDPYTRAAFFPILTSNYMHKALTREYLQQALLWRGVASPETVTDFKTWRWNRVGEFPNLPVVGEAATYDNDFAEKGPAEEEVTLAIEKRGGIFKLSWESIVDDDTRRFQRFPAKAARAAMRTLNYQVFQLLVNNTNAQDGVTVGHAATHDNLIAAAYSFANAKTMRQQMSMQRDLGFITNADAAVPQEMGRVRPRRMWCGSATWNAIYDDLFSDGLPTLTGTDSNAADGTPNALTMDSHRKPNVLRSAWGIELMPALQEIDDIDVDMYFMSADPSEADMIYVGFFRGKQEPELFIQDMQNVGTFFDNDVITHKIRHIYKAAIADWRPFQLGIP